MLVKVWLTSSLAGKWWNRRIHFGINLKSKSELNSSKTHLTGVAFAHKLKKDMLTWDSILFGYARTSADLIR